MKVVMIKILLLSSLMLPVLSSNSYSGHVYLSFVTHNEENEPYENYNYYILRRNLIVQLAQYVVQKNATWNFQSDWKFLVAVRNFDTGSVLLNTNGKNLIRWLTEDMGIECDPHAHETQYNYADIAYLHQQLGITPTKVVGGFIYNQIIGGNNWENLEQGIYGRVYTTYFWKPDILWGGGTPNHVSDPQNYGAWKPQSMANYYVHDSTKNLTLIGNGCSNKIYDTTAVSTALNRVRFLMNAYETGLIPDTGYYTSNVFMSIGQLNTIQFNKMKQFIDTVNIFAAQGRIQWKSVKEMYDIWNTEYNKRPFWLQCAQLPINYSILNITATTQGYFNAISNRASIRDTFKVYLRNATSPYAVVDSAKRVIDSVTLKASFAMTNVQNGNYYIVIKHRSGLETWSRTGGIPITRGATVNYDLTSSPSQAYGNNLILKGAKYCIYSGDVNGDGVIDANDISIIDNEAFTFSAGYTKADLTGDGIVDAADMAIADNNAFNFVQVIRP
jgi:hypothetical protein